MNIACVLRGGGEYGPEHVVRLCEDVHRHWSGDEPPDFLCLTDTPVGHDGVLEVALQHDWPGWWAKLELFRPDIPGPLLYIDLDCIVTGSLADMAALDGLTVLRDFLRPQGLQTALMVVPEYERAEVWADFWPDPWGHIRRHRSDQEYLEPLWVRRAARIQDALPGQVVGYKTDVRRAGGVPVGARVVMFHGRPRPWTTDLW